jgi:putative ABC transport system permease protein
MNPFIRFALWTCPATFRARYASQVLLDYEDRGVTSVGEIVRDLLVSGLMLRIEEMFRNLSVASRMLVKSPLFAMTAILAIALAIGANVAVASIFKGTFFAPLPYTDEQHLVLFSASKAPAFSLSYPNASDLIAQNRSFASMAIAGFSGTTMTGNGPSVQLRGSVVGPAYFDVLGVRPLLGRYFGPADAGSNRIVIAQSVWQRSFGSDARAIGKIVHLAGGQLDRGAYVIVGVAPAAFRDPVPTGLSQGEFWAPADPRSNSNRQRGWNQYVGIARLQRGVTPDAARADLMRIASVIGPHDPDNQMNRMSVTPLAWNVISPFYNLLWLLYITVAIVLFIACANVANLHMIRASQREREFTMRSALGASRGDLIRVLASEAALLAVAGGLLGILIGYAVLAEFSAYGTEFFPRWEAVRIDGPIVAYAAGLVALTTAISGILPAFLRGRRMQSSVRVAGRTHRGFVVVEIALAIAIVTAAGLLVKSFNTMTHVELGYDVQNINVVRVDGLALPAYQTDAAVVRFAKNVDERLRAIPGVESAVGVWYGPFGGKASTGLLIPGKKLPGESATELNALTPGYFAALHIPLVRGRDFTRDDDSRKVAIVSTTFARKYFGTLDIVGKRITPTMSASGPISPWTVIGVAADTRDGVSVSAGPMTYFPLAQMPNLDAFVVRTRGPVTGLTRAINGVFAGIDPNLPPPRSRSLADSLADNRAQSAFEMLLFGALACVALILALTGIYSVAAHTVQSRSREFAIRKSIGARSADILRGVLREALIAGTIGALFGIVLVALLAQWLSALLYQTSALDPVALLASVAIVIACALAASTVPALRATRADVAVTLRYE